MSFLTIRHSWSLLVSQPDVARVREIARELRVSHPAIIQQRKKIARISPDLLADYGCIGSGNGANGHSLVHAKPRSI